MQKYLKVGLIFVTFLIIILLLNNILKPPFDEQIKEFLLDNGYVISGNDNTLLHKYLDSNTINYFSLGDYTLNQTIEENNQNVLTSLSETYDYKNHVIKYNYHAEYSNNVNVLLRGEYKDNEFTCNKEFSSTSFTNIDINNTCNLIKIKIERFNSEASVLFNNYDFIKYIENVRLD